MDKSETESELLLVGIASSAGGITPLIELIENAICHKSMAFIIVPHLSRDFETALPQILNKVSRLNIEIIKQGDKIVPCHLYVLPPGYYASVKENQFELTPRPKKDVNHAADILFKSLSEFYRENAIGVVLSGSAVGADGSEGVKAIKRNGGHTYAQDPSTAQFPDMPNLAIATGCVDSVLPANVIGHDLTLLNWVKANEENL